LRLYCCFYYDKTLPRQRERETCFIFILRNNNLCNQKIFSANVQFEIFLSWYCLFHSCFSCFGWITIHIHTSFNELIGKSLFCFLEIFKFTVEIHTKKRHVFVKETILFCCLMRISSFCLKLCNNISAFFFFFVVHLWREQTISTSSNICSIEKSRLVFKSLRKRNTRQVLMWR